MIRDILAYVAAVVIMCSVIPYLRDILQRKTKPNIVTWLTWTVLTGVATAAAFAAHEPRTALLTLGTTISTAAVMLLGLKYGIAKLSAFDIVCWIGAGFGLVLWAVFDSPLLGILVPVIVDFVALVPTLRHAWRLPGEETWQTFAVSVLASVITVASLSKFTVTSLLYPVYLLFANSLLTWVIVARRRKVPHVE